MLRESIRHTGGQYVDGAGHTNTVEGFFSLLKHGVIGTFHHVSKGHLGRYVSEFEFRYNARNLSDGQRTRMLVAGAEGKRSPTSSQLELARIEKVLHRGRKWRREKPQSRPKVAESGQVALPLEEDR